MFLFRFIKFIYNYATHSPLFVLGYAYAFFKKDFSFKVLFYSYEELRQKMIEGKSLIRIGDGEIHLLNGGSLGYQKYERALDVSLQKIIKEYTDSSPYVLGINELVMDKSNIFLKKKNKFSLWLPMKVYYFLYFNKKAHYFDASLFYYDGVFDTVLKDHLTTKRLVVVTTKNNIDIIQKNKTIKNVIEYIEADSPNPHNSYGSISQKLTKYENQEDVVVILSCGPTSKIVAYEFCKKIQCIDIGIGLEVLWGRRGLTKLLEM